MAALSGPDDLQGALARVGLLLVTEPGEGGATLFLLQGNTFPNREIIKTVGGRWSRSRQAWQLASLDACRRLAQALPQGGAPAAPGLADGEAASLAGWPRHHYHGHRERLRTRFQEAGAEALADYELLELLLFFSIRFRDTKPLAKALIERFGSLGGVLAAEPARLAEPLGLPAEPALAVAGPGLAETAAATEASPPADGDGQALRDRRFTLVLLKLVQAILERVLKETIRERPVLGSWSALLDYLRIAMTHETTERFRVLFLDRKNILVKDEVQSRGTVDHTPLYPREVAKRALELGASAIIMVHNHPSGDPTPSRADVEMTKQVIEALRPIGVAVHDHVVVGKNRTLSFRSERLI